MSFTIPEGTRDILPNEMAEITALCNSLRGTFAGNGYREVMTPTLEYEEVFSSAVERAGIGYYRFTDDKGRSLVLKPDMTIPIARMVATSYGQAKPPLRLSSFSEVFRVVRPLQGQLRESLQAGIELFGLGGAEGDVEVLTLLCQALESVGLRDFKVGLGDARLYTSLLKDLEVPDEKVLFELVTRDFVGLEREVRSLRLDERTTEMLIGLPKLRGGPEAIEAAAGMASSEGFERAIEELRGCYEMLLQRGIADRFIFDLGLVRDLNYYTGVIFEVYDPGLGLTLGGGGRYDELLACFGRDLEAVGFDLWVDRLRRASGARAG